MIILHIGLHKAGSTTVQTYLRDNAEALAAAGVLYPAIGRAERSIAHHRLAADLRAGEADASQWAAIRSLSAEHPDKRVVISSEGFQSAEPAQVREMLDGEPVRVFCYHRDAAQRFVSIYGHGVKNGFRTTDFDQAFENQFAMKRTYIGETLKAWADAFGAENVRVRSLNPACLAEGDLMADVFEVLGLGADAEQRLGLKAVGSHNVSPGWKALEVLRALYADLGPGRPDPETTAEGRTARSALLRRALQAEARLGLKGRGNYLTQDQMRRLVELEDSDIASIQAAGIDCSLSPISLDGFEPRAFLPEYGRVPAEEAAALLREMLAAVVRDYVLRPGRVSEEVEEVEEAEAPSAAPAKPTPAQRKGVKAREKRIKAQAAAGKPKAGADPLKEAKQAAKADRKARKARKEGQAAPSAGDKERRKAEKRAERLAAKARKARG